MQSNRQSYNSIAKEWDAIRSVLLPYERPFLAHLTDPVKTPGQFLDLGCGTGRPVAEALLQQGHAVTGVDQADELLDLARQRLPQGRWLQAAMETFVPDEAYDGAVLWDSLFHVPREHHPSILGTVLSSLRAGARLILTVGGSDHPPFTDTMFGHDFFYDSHPPTEVLRMLRSLGATIDHAEFINPPTSGRDKGRFGIVASRV